MTTVLYRQTVESDATNYARDKSFVQGRQANLEASGFTITYDDVNRKIDISKDFTDWSPSE